MARCRALIADALAGVPFQVFRDRERLPTPTWILDPQNLAEDGRVGSSVRNVALSAVEFWSSVFVSAIELGEGIVYSPVLAEGESFGDRGCFVLNPKDVTIESDRYLVNNTEVGADELLVIRGRVWPGRYRGHGVWDQFAAEIGLGTSIREYAANMLGRGIPAGYLKVTAPDLEQTEADNLKRRWWEAHGGPDRRIAVLNATTEFHPLQIDPQALQLAELLRLSAWEIALIYGIPPYKLGISMGSNNTYANVESQSIDYVQDSLLPWARRAEAAFDAVLPWGTTLKLNLDGLRRADTKTRFDAYAVGLSNGFLTVDEVRRSEDLPPLNELDQRAALDYARAIKRQEVS
jgi:HK97 family phage portal protein